MNQNPIISARIKRYLIYIAVLLLAGLIVFWFYTHSILEVSITNTNGDAKVIITDQNNKKVKQINLKPGEKKKVLTTTGEKQITYTGDNLTALSVTKLKPFLLSSEVSLQTKSENKRTFIGDSPLPCTKYINDVLFSYECNGLLSSIQVHKPATSTEPTYTATLSDHEDPLTIIGTLTDGVNLIVLASAPNYGDDPDDEFLGDTYSYLKMTVNQNAEVVAEESIDSLDKKVTYRVINHPDSLLLVNPDTHESFVFNGQSIAPGQNIGKPLDESLGLQSINGVGSGGVLSVYSNQDLDSHDEEERLPADIVLTDDKKSTVINSDKSFRKAILCGDNTLCGLNGTDLEIHTIEGSSLKYLYKIIDIEDMWYSDNRLTASGRNALFNIDVPARSGYTMYSYGSYQSCGVGYDNKYLTACVISSNNQRYSLLIDKSADNKDSIDKKLSGFFEDDNIDKVSPYKNYIYIAPNAGELMYVESIGEYGYDPVEKQKTTNAVNALIQKSNLQKEGYTFINTIQ